MPNIPYGPPPNYPPENLDPLVVDQGWPLDEHGQNLARDFIAPVVIPYGFPYPPQSNVSNVTEYSPTSIGVEKSDGPTHWTQYAGIPGFAARLDIATGTRCEYYTKNLYSNYTWGKYKETILMQRLITLGQFRDQQSDILNMWGTKPLFEDNWYRGFSRPTRPPSPNVQF